MARTRLQGLSLVRAFSFELNAHFTESSKIPPSPL